MEQRCWAAHSSSPLLTPPSLPILHGHLLGPSGHGELLVINSKAFHLGHTVNWRCEFSAEGNGGRGEHPLLPAAREGHEASQGEMGKKEFSVLYCKRGIYNLLTEG